jgi:hypothetical protein
MDRKTILTIAAGALILMLLVPGVASGHHVNGHNEPFPKEVIVANGADAPIPTEVTGEVEVRQAGPFEVELNNTFNDPVPVQPQPRQPFQYLFAAGQSQHCEEIPIPEGRTLEVQSVSVAASVSAEHGQPQMSLQLLQPGGQFGFSLVPAGAIEMFEASLEDPTGTIDWHGSLTGLTLFAGRVGGATFPLLVCPGAVGLYSFRGTVSGRLE